MNEVTIDTSVYITDELVSQAIANKCTHIVLYSIDALDQRVDFAYRVDSVNRKATFDETKTDRLSEINLCLSRTCQHMGKSMIAYQHIMKTLIEELKTSLQWQMPI